MKYEYYYNNVPGEGLCRNNLIYTSLISNDGKQFVQWYHNDTDYHKGKNQVVDSRLMEEKWQRELKYLTLMNDFYPEHIPKILDIDHSSRKIYLEIEGLDFWQLSLDKNCSFDEILPDWQEQMLEIISSYKQLGIYKYSMHPSSYFIVDGKLKSINYFFTYERGEGPITIADHASHISENRQKQMRLITEEKNISWDKPYDLNTMQHLCFESFRTNYTDDFINKARAIYDQRY
jgi:hypothetical protein